MKSLIKIAMIACLALMLMACNTENETDFTSPMVIYTLPTNGESNVSVDTTITIAFNEEINPYTVTSSSFTLTRVGAFSKVINSTVSSLGNLATLTPDVPLEPNTTFVATITSYVTDNNGNGIPLGYMMSFTTGALTNSIASFTSAIMVTGQSDFTNGASNMGGTPTQYSMSAPAGAPYVYNATGSLLLPDTGNNRILGYSYFPSYNGYPADFVFGQYDYISNSPMADYWGLSSPRGFHMDEANGWSAVTDTGNNRIMIWAGLPSAAAFPYVLLGQADYYGTVAYCDQSHLNQPSSAIVVNGKVIVADTGNNRVLIWDSVPSTSGYGSYIVLGQSSFDTCAAGAPNAATLNAPTSVWSDGNILIVADTGNNRVLLWTAFPTYSAEPATIVIGQPNVYTSVPYTSSVNLNGPTAVTSDGKKLIVADTGNNRVLIWNSLPDMSNESADVVLGQASFLTGAPNDDNNDSVQDANPSARTLFAPSGMTTYYGYLLVGDTGNNRYLTYYLGR